MEIVILIAVLAAVGSGIWLLARRRLKSGHSMDTPSTLADRLPTGDAGIKWAVPASWTQDGSNTLHADYVDEAKGQLWRISISHLGLDVSEQHFELLRQDIEAQAREMFESDTPRTRQGAWSPVVSIEPVDLDGTRSVQTIYRLAYEPCNEVVVGQLMIPLAQGFAAISVTTRAGITGVRETALAMRAMMDNDPEDESPAELSQEEIDNPARDDGGLSPVSAVRDALRWLGSTDGAELGVTQPAEPIPSHLTLNGPACSISAPPRYVQVADDFPRSPTMDVLTRVGLGIAGARMLDVYKVPDRQLDIEDLDSLEELARANAQGWADEGANDISCEIQAIEMDDGRTHTGNHIKMSAGGIPSHIFAHWFIDHDGTIFRVGAGGPPRIPLEELVADALHVVETFQREDAAN